MIYHYVLVDNLMFISELQCVFNLKFRNAIRACCGRNKPNSQEERILNENLALLKN